VGAGIPVTNVHTNGWGVETQSSVKALQPLLQPGVRSQEILKMDVV
jgi:hypothetical protein